MGALPQPPFYRQFLRLAAVNVLSNLMVPLAGLIDVAFLGHLADIRHLAGVALATVLFNYLYWSFGFLRMATTGLTAQALGRGDTQGVLIIGLRNGGLAIALGLVILLLQYPVREFGFAVLSASPEVKASGIDYYNAMVWGAPATLLNFVLIGWLLGQGRGSGVLLLSLVANLGNALLNYGFIVRLGWASAGAGWGTALSQYLMLLTGLCLVYRDIPWARIKEFGADVLDGAALRAAFQLNGDILIRTFALVTTFAVFTNLSSGFGTTILAANTLLLQVVSFAAYFIDGLAFATESYAGLFRGRGESRDLWRLLSLSGGISLALGLLFAGGYLLFSRPLLSLLTSHNAVIVQAQAFVGWLLPVLGFGSIAYMLDGYFLGLTEGYILKTSSLVASLLGFAPAAIASLWLKSPQILWLGMTSFMAARAMTLGLQVPETLKRSRSAQDSI